MAYTIPNEDDASNANQAEPDKVDFDILVAGYKGDGIVSGCGVSQRGAGANMSVDVAPGEVRVGSTVVAVSSGNLVIGAADGTDPRFDLVVVDNAGDKSIEAGTPDANPVFPSIPASSVVLAAVYIPANDSSIEDAQITDKRVAAQLATKEYVDSAIHFIEDYFFNDTASSYVGIYYKMLDTPTGQGQSTFTTDPALGEGDNQSLFNFATDAGIPGVTILEAGVYGGHIHARVTLSNKRPVKIHFKVYYRENGNEELVATSEESDFLTNSNIEYSLHATLAADITIAITDRLIIKWFANVGSTPASNVIVELFAEGTNASRFSVPVPTDVLNQVFVRQDGTRAFTGEQSMGTNKLTDVVDPGANQDAATKKYVDDNLHTEAHAAAEHSAANIIPNANQAYTGDMGITGALTATSYGGITEANLVDKSAAEAIAGKWAFSDYITLNEIAAPGGDPSADTGWLYTKDDGGTTKLYFEDPAGLVTDLLAGGGGGQDLATDTLWAAQGDLVKGTGDDGADILTIGADHTILVSNGTDPGWSAIPPLAGIADTGDTTRIALSAGSPHVAVTGSTRLGAVNSSSQVSINSAAGAGAVFTIQPSITTGANWQGLLVNPTIVTSANGLNIYGLLGAANVYPAAGSSGHLVYGLAYQGLLYMTATGTSTAVSVIGIDIAAVAIAGTGTNLTAAKLIGADVKTSAIGAGGLVTVTAAIGVRIQDPGSNRVGHYTGLQIDNEASATGTVIGFYTDMVGDYAIFVDAGLSRFDGNGTRVFELPEDDTDPTGGGALAVGRIPVLIGGGTHYLAYY